MKGKDLLVVESPTKARTIQKVVGGRLRVLSSQGHIRDLPKSRLGVDLERGFAPQYILIREKSKIIKELRAAAQVAPRVYLGSDPDREGEAIAYHLSQELNCSRVERVLFYEITPEGIRKGLANPGPIDGHKVDAHKARRVLDRLVGYLVSPVLWRAIRRGLSAGRVQTVALRLMVEREAEIRDFLPQEYWTVQGVFLTETDQVFEAELSKIRGASPEIRSQAQAEAIRMELLELEFRVEDLRRYERCYSPPPPHITSSLQQEASTRLRISPARTMELAQQLFEGVTLAQETVGLITYPRTDSVRVAGELVDETREFIRARYGEEWVPDSPRVYRDRRTAQGAHEAIRPTSITRTPDEVAPYLGQAQLRIYALIYFRFLASQMADARYEAVDVVLKGGEYEFRASSLRQRFAGFEAVYPVERPVRPDLPEFEPGAVVRLKEVELKQHFTHPPPRYTEATLIRTLEQRGIGRPSTYASIVSTLLERRYAERAGRALRPTELGELVAQLLIPRFGEVFAIDFTRELEAELDQIEAGEKDWSEVVRRFYEPLSRQLEAVEAEIEALRGEFIETAGESCPECGRPLVVRWGRYGKFLACPGFPDCRYSRPLKGPEETQEECPECGRGLVVREGRNGRFLACSGYPGCRYTRSLEERLCPECGKPMRLRRGRFGRFWACSGYPECSHKESLKPKAGSEDGR